MRRGSLAKLTTLLLTLFLAGPALGAGPGNDGPEEATTGPSGRYLLMDPNGRAVTNQDFPGRFQLITFGYTYCPDICPTTLLRQASVLRELGERADRVQAIFITVDPQRDSPEVLHRYTSYFDPRIIGLTGSPELIAHAAEQFRVRYERVQEPGAPTEAYHMDHTAGLFLLGPDGSYIRRFPYEAAAAEVVERIADLLEEEGVGPVRPRPGLGAPPEPDG